MKFNTTLISILFCLLTISCSTTNVEKSTSSTSTTIYLVRHAEKMDDGTKDPPLTNEGRERADKLSTILKKHELDHIYSSDYKRTQQTAVPTSRMAKLAIKSYDPRALEDFAKQLLTMKGEIILVVGHSNSTPSLANLLVGQEQFQAFDESDYGNLITVTVDDAKREAIKTRF